MILNEFVHIWAGLYVLLFLIILRIQALYLYYPPILNRVKFSLDPVEFSFDPVEIKLG